MSRWYVALYDGATDDREGAARRVRDGTEDGDGMRDRWPQILGWLEDDPSRYVVVRAHWDDRRALPSLSGVFGSEGVNG